MALDGDDKGGSTKDKDVDVEPGKVGVGGDAKKEPDDNKDEKKERTYSEAHVKGLIAERDKAKKLRRAAEATLVEVKDNLEGIEDLRTELKELRTFKEEAVKKEEDLKLKDASELEKIKITTEKEIQRLEKDIEQSQTEAEKKINEITIQLTKKDAAILELRGFKLESQITKAANKFHPWNAEQIIQIVKPLFSYDEEEAEWKVVKRDKAGEVESEQTVDEYIAEFLGDPLNENLIKVDISGAEADETPGINYELKKKNKSNVKITPAIEREAKLQGYTTKKQIEAFAASKVNVAAIKARKKKELEKAVA